MTGSSDRELVAACLRGEAAAWESFVDRFSKLIHWSIRKTAGKMPPGGHQEFCREVFQDFFQRLLDKNELSKLKEASHIRKFLSVMACHLAVDRLKHLTRQARNTGTVEDLLPHQEALVVAPPADEAVDWEEICGASLKELPLEERLCLEFYFLEGKTAEETGKILGMSENSVHYVVKRCKEKIRAKLVERGYKDP